VINWDTVGALGISHEQLAAVIADEERELDRRELDYRGRGARPVLAGRVVLLVDDGLATGATMRAAVAALREQRPARIVIAVPLAAPSTCQELAAEVDDIVCAMTPAPFYSVGRWYEDFEQTTDEEVRELLRVAARAEAEGAAGMPAAEG
jgi:putative phosphoribosyl transferase